MLVEVGDESLPGRLLHIARVGTADIRVIRRRLRPEPIWLRVLAAGESGQPPT